MESHSNTSYERKADIPPVGLFYLRMMYSLFKLEDLTLGVRKLEYIEPIFSVYNVNFWKIEFRVERKKYEREDLRKIVSKLKSLIGEFDEIDICYNFSDRVYLSVRPSKTKPLKIKPPKSQAAIQRDLDRSAAFKKKMAIKDMKKDEQQTTSAALEKESTSSEPSSSTKNFNFVGMKFVSGGMAFTGVQTNKVVVEPVLPDKPRDAEPAKPDGQLVSKEMKNPIARMTLMSSNSQDQKYAVSRFRDPRILYLVRKYLAYLEKSDDLVIDDGDSKLTCEVKIKSEGLPLGSKLKDMYYKFLREYDITEESVDKDLTALRSYYATSRLVRIQTAREKTSRWLSPLGLKGGSTACSFNLIERPYYNVVSSACSDQLYVRSGVVLDEAGHRLEKFN